MTGHAQDPGPLDVFASGEEHWLGVQVAGLAHDDRAAPPAARLKAPGPHLRCIGGTELRAIQGRQPPPASEAVGVRRGGTMRRINAATMSQGSCWRRSGHKLFASDVPSKQVKRSDKVPVPCTT